MACDGPRVGRRGLGAMALKVDYYTSLLRAVDGLDRDAYAARGAIYEREHKALMRLLYSADPPRSEAEIEREQRPFATPCDGSSSATTIIQFRPPHRRLARRGTCSGSPACSCGDGTCGNTDGCAGEPGAVELCASSCTRAGRAGPGCAEDRRAARLCVAGSDAAARSGNGRAVPAAGPVVVMPAPQRPASTRAPVIPAAALRTYAPPTAPHVPEQEWSDEAAVDEPVRRARPCV